MKETIGGSKYRRIKILKTGKPGRPRMYHTQLHEFIEEVSETLHQAFTSVNSDKWRQVFHAEMSSLRRNGTWSLVDLPEGVRTINSKWVFALKKNELGQIDRYRNDETFSPVVRYSAIRLILALAVHWKMYLHEIDISSAKCTTKSMCDNLKCLWFPRVQ